MKNLYSDLDLVRYNEYIDKIILNRGQWSPDVLNSSRGCEKHHIKLACMGGDGDYLGKDGKWKFRHKSNHSNCIYLYPSEHYEIHQILYEDNKDNSQISLAFWRMCSTKSGQEITSSDQYEEVRSNIHPNKGKPAWNKGLSAKSDGRVKNYIDKASSALKHNGSVKGDKNGMYGKGYLISGEKNGMYGRSGDKNPMFGKNAFENKNRKEMETISLKMRESKKKNRKYNSIKCKETNKLYDFIDDISKDLGLTSSRIRYSLDHSHKPVDGYNFMYIQEV